MKKLMIGALALLTASLVQAQSYVGFGIGYMIDHEENVYSIRVGKEFESKNPDYLNRLELEYNYARYNQTDYLGTYAFESTLDINLLMVNYRGSYALGSGLSANFGGGLGVGFLKVDVDDGFATDTDTSAAYQIFAGLDYELEDGTIIGIGLRHVKIGDTTVTDRGYSIDLKDLDDTLIEFSVRGFF
jgi:opacity protein-like surface antigen